MIEFIRTHRIGVGATAVAALAGIAWLAFGYFGVHTLFVDDVVDEAGPTFDVAAVPAEEAAVSDEPAPPVSTAPAAVSPGSGATADDDAAARAEGAADATSPPASAPPAGQADETGAGEPTDDDATTTAPAASASEPAPEPPATTAAAPEIVTEFAGTFVGESRYDTAGAATVLGNGTGQRFLRFENFETSNGPDLNVYLFNVNGDRGDFIDLGDLKGNIGDQNYEIPEGVDLEVYGQVSIWCVRFGVGFGTADLMPT